MQLCFRLDGSTRYIILQLINKCGDLNLDNMSFYYSQDNIYFYLTAQEGYWELVVKHGSTQEKDVYWISGEDTIAYQYSEKIEEQPER